MPPNGMQTIVNVTANGRCRRGTYSEASAAAFGMAPPKPSPARNRRTPSSIRLLTVEIASVSAANEITLDRSAVRRPMRSPNIPPMAPPIIIPSGLSARTVEKAPRGSDHSFMSDGTALPSNWLSTPSRMIVSAVPRMSSFWYVVQRPSSITWPTSTVFINFLSGPQILCRVNCPSAAPYGPPEFSRAVAWPRC